MKKIININVNGSRQFGYFSEKEFKLSKLSYEDVDNFNLDRKCILVANYVRLCLGSMYISSCGRTELKNASLQNSGKYSQHRIIKTSPVRATDLHPKGTTVAKMQKWVINNRKVLYMLGVRGIGFYSWGVHFDVRPQKNMSAWGMNSTDLKKLKETKFWSI